MFSWLTSIWDRVNSFWDSLLQNAVLRAVFGPLEWIDWVFFAFVIFGVIGALRKGAARSFVGAVLMFVLIYVSFEFYEGAASAYTRVLKSVSKEMLTWISFVALACVSLVGGKVLSKGIASVLPPKKHTPIRVLTAAGLGMVTASLLLSVLVYGLILAPWEAPKRVLERGESMTGYGLALAAPAVYGLISEPGKLFSRPAKS